MSHISSHARVFRVCEYKTGKNTKNTKNQFVNVNVYVDIGTHLCKCGGFEFLASEMLKCPTLGLGNSTKSRKIPQREENLGEKTCQNTIKKIMKKYRAKPGG